MTTATTVKSRRSKRIKNGEAPKRTSKGVRSDASLERVIASQLRPGEWFAVPSRFARIVKNRFTQWKKWNLTPGVNIYSATDGRLIVLHGDVPPRSQPRLCDEIEVHTDSPPLRRGSENYTAAIIAKFEQLQPGQWIKIPSKLANKFQSYVGHRRKHFKYKSYRINDLEHAIVRIGDEPVEVKVEQDIISDCNIEIQTDPAPTKFSKKGDVNQINEIVDSVFSLKPGEFIKIQPKYVSRVRTKIIYRDKNFNFHTFKTNDKYVVIRDPE